MNNKSPQPYWIVIAGLPGAGKSTFLRHAAETITLRDRQDMSVITPEEQQDILQWLASSGSALDPERDFTTPEERRFRRWMRRITVGEIPIDARMTVYFYEAPGTREFDFMWNLITPETYLGAITVIDSTQHHTIRDASRLAATFAAYSPEPYVFAANKQDRAEALPVEDMRILLQYLDGHLLPVVPCDATDPHSVQKVLLRFLELIRDSYDDGIEW